jgi:ABC-type microcin C transport system permease subunit YejB
MNTGAGETRSEKKMEKKEINSWMSSFAVFGESVWALTFSFLLLLIAVGISFWLDTPGSSTSDPYDKLGPVPSINPPHIYHVPTDVAITDEIMAAYKRDGVVAVSGLIGPELLKRLDLESSDFLEEQRKKNQGRKRSGTQFHTVYHGAIFRNTPTASDIHGLTNSTLSPFLDLSLISRVPQLAAKLLGMRNDGNNETMRLLRDIFLAKVCLRLRLKRRLIASPSHPL